MDLEKCSPVILPEERKGATREFTLSVSPDRCCGNYMRIAYKILLFAGGSLWFALGLLRFLDRFVAVGLSRLGERFANLLRCRFGCPRGERLPANVADDNNVTTFHPFAVHMPACLAQQGRYPVVAVATMLPGKCDDVLGQGSCVTIRPSGGSRRGCARTVRRRSGRKMCGPWTSFPTNWRRVASYDPDSGRYVLEAVAGDLSQVQLSR